MSITDTIMDTMTFGLVNTKDITVDENGQRDVERRRVQFNKIMKNFDPHKVNPPKLALIDGKYFCFDGQMTIKVLKAKNKGRDLEIMCAIYTGLTLLEVANLFCAQNENKSPVKVSDVIRVKAAYGDQDCINFMRYTEKAGVDISWNHIKSKNAITAVSVAFQCFLRFKDPERYTAMLRCLKDAFDGMADAFDHRLIRGMTEFFTVYQNIDVDRLAKKLTLTRPSDIIRDAQIDRASGPRKYAVIILQWYNHGARENVRLQNNL